MKSVVRSPAHPVAIERPPLPVRLVRWLVEAGRLYRQRAALEAVSDAHLADLGLTREEVDASAQAIRPLADAWAAVNAQDNRG
ncbi:MAG: DUF1127 domain-containing protein [Pseudomonadota bacterium]